MPDKHARFSPSAAKRHLTCTSSLLLEEQFPDSISQWAEEGTAGHALAEHLIKEYLKIKSKRPASKYYTDELTSAVDDYVSFVKEQIEQERLKYKYPIFNVEQKVDAGTYVEECFGTADMVIITDDTIHIIDLKLGKGVPVYAKDNYQLMIYALGVLDDIEMFYDIKNIKLTIHQPRLQNISSWEVSAEELILWGNDFLRPIAAMALKGEGNFVAGEHCQFCKAKHQCRARAADSLRLAQLEFKEAPLLSDGEITEILSKANQLSKWAADIYTYAQVQAINNGKVWTGYKLVKGRANRKYTNDADVIIAAKEAGYKDIFNHILISPAEMEKKIGKKKFKEILGDLVYRPEGKLTLVPETDKREAVNRATAADDFKVEKDCDEDSLPF